MTKRLSPLLTPGRLILAALITTVACGTVLLSLTCSQKNSVAFIDIFFTALSATTVTGLLTVPLESFTRFGHMIILSLIQIGGLGIITLSVFLVTFFAELGIPTTFGSGTFGENHRKTRKLLLFIIFMTALFESIGAFVIWHSLPVQYKGMQRLFYALFHSISAFCNAGFSLFPQGMEEFRHNVPFLLASTFLIFCGGLGFITLYELVNRLYGPKEHHSLPLSLYTKVVLITTFLITMFVTLIFWILEYGHTLKGIPSLAVGANVLFDAISARGAGFTTLDIGSLRLATTFIIMIACFIGSSPGSTGSGIKTTTFAVFLATIKAVLRGHSRVELLGHKIPHDQVFRALSVFFLSLTWIGLAIFGLLITEEGWHFLDVVFESFSAFTNLGLSTGITPYLTWLGKIYIMLVMIAGRIGSLTVLIALRPHLKSPEIEQREEHVTIS